MLIILFINRIDQCQEIQELIDLLLVAFQNTSSLEIMEWLYKILNQYLNKSIDFIVFEKEELVNFWLKTFKTAAYQGNTDLVRWLFDVSLTNIFGYNLNENENKDNSLAEKCLINDDYDAFRNAICQGHLSTAELIYDLGFIYNWPINLHNNNEWCFYWACHHGNLPTAKWLYYKAKSVVNPFTNTLNIYHNLLEVENTLDANKLVVLEWLRELPEIVNKEWVIIDRSIK